MAFRGINPRLLGPVASGLLVVQNTTAEARGEEAVYLRATEKPKERKEGVRVPHALQGCTSIKISLSLSSPPPLKGPPNPI